MSLLLKHASVNKADRDGLTALHHAAVLGQDDSLDLLVHADLDVVDNEGKTPMQLAIENGQFNAVQ